MNKQAALILILSQVLFTGVAQAGPVPTVRIRGESYLGVSDFTIAQGLFYAWDPLLKNVKVTGPNGSVTCHVGSEYVLSQGKLVRLPGKVRLHNGDVMAPMALLNHLQRLESTGRYQAPPAAPTGHRIRKIVVDAGHGGHDSGAVSPQGTKEKELVLDVAQRLAGRLRADGFEVVMTRNSDVFISLGDRASITNAKEADLFVSVHANASSSAALHGFEAYYFTEWADDYALALDRAGHCCTDQKLYDRALPDADRGLKTVLWDLKETDNRRQSLKLAHSILNEANHVEKNERRIRGAEFQVLKYTQCPAVLLEIGYITNPAEERRLVSATHREDLARSIASGLLNYTQEFERTQGFSL